MSIKRIAIVGAGLMAKTMSIVFAANPDLEVKVWAFSEQEKAQFIPAVAVNLSLMTDYDIYDEKEAEKILSRIEISCDLESVVKQAHFIIECIPEDMTLKQDMMQRVETMCSGSTILATNTSVMSVTDIFSRCKKRDRVVGSHFWNPAHLIPLVEVVKTEATSSEVIDQTMALLAACQKKPVLCQKDVPGFIANRLQHAVWREAFYMVDNGIADAATIDEAVKFGPGLRWPVMGPMENSDLVGIDLSKSIHDYLLPHLADNHQTSARLAQMLSEGKNGFKTGEGWQKWTDSEIEQSQRTLQRHLLENIANQKKKK